MSDKAGASGEDAQQGEPQLVISSSRHFVEWLAGTGGALAFTTYQAGKLFLIGVDREGDLGVFERTFDRCMGLVAGPRTLWLATKFQLFKLHNGLRAGESYHGRDALYIPRVSWTTGDLDAHDIGIDKDGAPIFVATVFSCLARPSDTVSFTPIWKPPFISKLAPEDRCHLNGLAMEHGEPRYVSAVGVSDVADGWREHRREGGVVIDVASSEIVARGLSMPHSPRLKGGRLWIVNSGTGEFGHIEVESGRFEPIAFCPGYARGLAFAGGAGVIGLSLARENRTFSGLPLDDNLAAKGASARCGLHVVDLKTGDAPHWLRIEGLVRELYDVVFLPGVREPAALGFKNDEIARTLVLDPDGPI